MKRFLALLSLAVLVLTGCGGSLASNSPAKLSTSQMVSHEGYSTVALVHYDEDNDDPKVSDIRTYCSAVWVDDTHILTAFHCVKGEQKRAQAKQDEREQNQPACGMLAALLGLCDPDAPVKHTVIWMKGLPVHYVQWKESADPGKEPSAWHLGNVVGWDEGKDLALVEAAGNAIPSHEVAVLADETPALGESIHVCGHPKGFTWTFLEGTVAGYRGVLQHHDKDTGPYMQAQVPVYFGNSGGGAFDSYGKLVGIADMLPGLPAEGLFVHLDNIRGFLQDQNLLDKPKKEVKSPKVVGVAPKEEAPPPPVKKDDTTTTVVTPPSPVVPEAPKVEPKKLPTPTFHIPKLPPGLFR